MADLEDVEALKEGNLDLVHRDFRKATLVGLDLQNRDFTEALLNEADLSGCNLNGCVFLQAQLHLLKVKRAELRDTQWDGAIHAVDFSGADLRGAKLNGLITGCKFIEADLRGCDFRGSRIHEGTDFSRAISDETTIFDDVRIFRPIAQNKVFAFYRVERGKLVKIPDLALKPAEFTITGHDTTELSPVARFVLDVPPSAAPSQPDESAPKIDVYSAALTPSASTSFNYTTASISSAKAQTSQSPTSSPPIAPVAPIDIGSGDDVERLTAQIDRAVESLRQLSPAPEPTGAASPMLGHNQPPLDVAPLTADEMAELSNALTDTKANIASAEPDADRLRRSGNIIKRYATQIFEHVKTVTGWLAEALREKTFEQMAEAALDHLKTIIIENWQAVGWTLLGILSGAFKFLVG